MFSHMTDKEEIQLRDNLLAKVGVSFENEIIMIKDDLIWTEVSMQERIKFALPSTTNSLEAFHRQLNSQTPRRNNFFCYSLKYHSNEKKHPQQHIRYKVLKGFPEHI